MGWSTSSGIAPERRLVAHDVAGGGGDADRAAGVGAVGQHGHAGGERGAGAARRAAGGVLQAPGVAGDAPERARGDRRVGELRRGRARVHDAAGIEQAGDGGCGALGPVVGERLGAEGGELARHRMKILDGDRNAFQGPRLAARIRRLGRAGLVERALGMDLGEGVERGVDGVDPRQRRLHERDRRERAGLERGNRFRGGERAELAGGQGHSLFPCPTAPPRPAVYCPFQEVSIHLPGPLSSSWPGLTRPSTVCPATGGPG